jgi:hypothetical protein
LFNGNRKEYCGITTVGKFSNPDTPLIKGAYAIKVMFPDYLKTDIDSLSKNY